jgi:hypothetical protein
MASSITPYGAEPVSPPSTHRTHRDVDMDVDTRTILILLSSAGVTLVCRTQCDSTTGACTNTFQITVNAAHPRWSVRLGDLLQRAMPRIREYLGEHLADEFGDRALPHFQTASYRKWSPPSLPRITCNAVSKNQ